MIVVSIFTSLLGKDGDEEDETDSFGFGVSFIISSNLFVVFSDSTGGGGVLVVFFGFLDCLSVFDSFCFFGSDFFVSGFFGVLSPVASTATLFLFDFLVFFPFPDDY